MNVAFIGHRNTAQTKELKERLLICVENLIAHENADTFLFGSKSAFNDICYDLVSRLKTRHKHIRRVFVRAEYENINKEYSDYLLSLYETTFFPPQAHRAGAAAYIERNRAMIDICDVLITYFDDGYSPQTGNKISGTKRAVEYARLKNKRIINLFEQ